MIFLFIAILLTAIIFSLRFKWWGINIPYKYPRILMYHMIAPHLPKNISKFNRLRVTPNAFEKQLLWLKNNGYTSYTLSELAKYEQMPEKSVVLTFDDGYKDNFTNAFPLLQKYGFKATIFIVLERFNQNWATDKDLNAPSQELNNEAMLSDDEIKIMLQSGLIEIGSHTLNHANLPRLSDEEKTKQLLHSKEQIEKIFGIQCTSFAYPFGFFDEKCVNLVKDAGYQVATTVINDVYKQEKYSFFEIPRLMISGRHGLYAFILKIKKGRSR